MIMLQRLGACPVCFTGTDESLGDGVPSWRDLPSCLCPKASYMKQLLALTWEGEDSHWRRKGCLSQSFQVEIVWKTLSWVMCYFKIWPGRSVCTQALELQAGRCFCGHKPAWSCHVLLDPTREGEIWQKWDTSFVLQDLLWFFELLSFRGKLKQILFRGFQKLEEINSSQTSFHQTSLPYPDQPKETTIWSGHSSGPYKCQV